MFKAYLWLALATFVVVPNYAMAVNYNMNYNVNYNVTTCQNCKTIFSVFQNLPSDEVRNISNTICQRSITPMSSYYYICQALKGFNGDITERYNPSNLCMKLGMCPFVLDSSESTCYYCKFIIDVAKDWLKDGDNQYYLIKIFNELCTKMIPSSSICDKIDKFIIKELVNLIEEHSDSSKICSFLRMC